jgi:ribosomal protein L11 methyltransferase
VPWLQLRIVTDRESVSRVERSLLHYGALSVTFEDNADQAIFEPALGETPLWQETRVTGLFSADIDSSQLADSVRTHAKLDAKQLHWHILEDKDWEREWMTNYHPIQCSEQFWICPSWMEPPDPSAHNLILDPGLAFGTGTHPTTFMCLQWLAKQDCSKQEVMDYGCGSGILGIATLLLGAHSFTGVDIDPQALIATRDNAERNHLNHECIDIYLPEDAPNKTYDMVLANILAGPLVELSDTLIEMLKPGAKLCLSGVLATQEEAIRNAYAGNIAFAETAHHEEWICLSGEKIDHR